MTSKNNINKLEANETYNIISYNTIEGKFGKSYVMKDDNFNEYFSNKKVNDWIKKNQNKMRFKIKTGDWKEFTSSDGNTIRFLDTFVSN